MNFGRVLCNGVAKPSRCTGYSEQVLVKPLHREQHTAFFYRVHRRKIILKSFKILS